MAVILGEDKPSIPNIRGVKNKTLEVYEFTAIKDGVAAGIAALMAGGTATEIELGLYAVSGGRPGILLGKGLFVGGLPTNPLVDPEEANGIPEIEEETGRENLASKFVWIRAALHSVEKRPLTLVKGVRYGLAMLPLDGNIARPYEYEVGTATLRGFAHETETAEFSALVDHPSKLEIFDTEPFSSGIYAFTETGLAMLI